ncbi:MAG: hypothetical protein FD152_1710 [Xanthobacteraceae bacterium]|nr:MAG: hypothetical protein FD152_1710 [Xanthobacteraceae bacterium]
MTFSSAASTSIPRSAVPRLATSTVLILGGLAGLGSGRLLVLGLIGLAMGLALYHAAFGFSHGFRMMLRNGRSAHVRAQIVMLGIAVLLFLPALAAGEVFGQAVRGFHFPLGPALVVGAFLFGAGMQISGGCVSGTLYTAGGGSVRMWITLLAAVTGATIAAHAAPLWTGWPQWPAISLPATMGLGPALALHAVVFLAAYAVLLTRERRRFGSVETIVGRGRWLTGPWPYAWAAIALAVLNFATLVTAGRPWGVTQAFALWGSKAAEATGLADPVFWPFWEDPTRVEALLRPLSTDPTTVMNLAVIAGAFVAALFAGRFAPSWRVRPGEALGSLVGGLLIGAGAIIATGCNISAFFSGIASGSLHGWVWIAAALPGSWLGLRLRPLFGLDAAPGR